VDETISTQANITDLRGSLYTIMALDVKPDLKNFLSNNFIKLFFWLLGYKDVESEYDSHIQLLQK
jgi:hypothetical protein